MKVTPKILIVGHGRHGKDTLAQIINLELEHKFRGSSEVAAREVIYPVMSNFYSSPEDAFERRHDNRELWRALISDFNREDPTKLACLVCEGGYGYVGLRDKTEVISAVKQGFFTHVIWVKRPDLEENDTTMMFTLEDLEKLQEKGFLRNLAVVHNHSVEILKDIVVNEIKEFLGEYHRNCCIYLKVDRKELLEKPAS